jgi:hypothetical protein
VSGLDPTQTPPGWCAPRRAHHPIHRPRMADPRKGPFPSCRRRLRPEVRTLAGSGHAHGRDDVSFEFSSLMRCQTLPTTVAMRVCDGSTAAQGTSTGQRSADPRCPRARDRRNERAAANFSQSGNTQKRRSRKLSEVDRGPSALRSVGPWSRKPARPRKRGPSMREHTSLLLAKRREAHRARPHG